MNIQSYINEINREYIKGNATEHTFRGTLKILLETICTDVDATNEPKKTEGGNPDYEITKKGTKTPVAYIEAKDIGKNLDDKNFKNQFDRYKKAYDNLIITDYLKFQFFESKKLIHQIDLGKVINGKVEAIPSNFKEFEDYLKIFITKPSITIKNSQKLAEMMAARARVLQNQIESALLEDIEKGDRFSAIYGHFENFKRVLIHDLDEKQFSDLFAQTLAYGLFAARLYDETLDDFSREEASRLIPKSNPFLKKLFADIAGPNIDDRIERTVDNLADVFKYANVEVLLKDLGKNPRTSDPIIHFYETFLTEYDKGLRQERGVWYTPQPVVNFIVKSVDEVLKLEFGIRDGIADTSKTEIRKDELRFDERSRTKSKIIGKTQSVREVHRVQILDPATGTGTFLAEVISYIYEKKYKHQEAIWSSYVEKNLIPRLNGFEFLMAPYAIAHVKLAMLLKQTGYVSENNTRFNVFLTNTLEESDENEWNLFSPLLSEESALANKIKRDTPVMCIIGNPPYSGESANKGEWIMGLMDDYKKEPGGKVKLNERNPKWINDDYVKFMRYGQFMIEKNGSGVLAFINPHGFLDNPTFRGMRWNLLKTYDKIYTIDLHGNSKKKETHPDGSVDQNVFNIQQGVSINILIKTGKKKSDELGKVFHKDLYGTRDVKDAFLNDNSIRDIDFTEIPNIGPMYFMVPKDFETEKAYKRGFSVSELFVLNNVGLVTSRDSFVIDKNKTVLSDRIKDFFILKKDLLKSKYGLRENNRWKIDSVQQLELEYKPEEIQQISYRPFDDRFLYYNKNFVERSRLDVMQHFMLRENVGLTICKQFKAGSKYRHAFVSNKIIESSYVSNKTSEITYTFPLYLHEENNNQGSIVHSRLGIPNLSHEIVDQFAKQLGLSFTNEKESIPTSFAPIDVLDYIYAVLYSPSYREKYNEFLKIDFPKVPYPSDKDNFWKLVQLGGTIRKLHLLESDILDAHNIYAKGIVSDPETNLLVERSKLSFEAETDTHGKVWINSVQYFENVPQKAWEFFIGGYQPAQKWLKDRSGSQLSDEDVLHYQKIIFVLAETDRLMNEIDEFIEL